MRSPAPSRRPRALTHSSPRACTQRHHATRILRASHGADRRDGGVNKLLVLASSRAAPGASRPARAAATTAPSPAPHGETARALARRQPARTGRGHHCHRPLSAERLRVLFARWRCCVRCCRLLLLPARCCSLLRARLLAAAFAAACSLVRCSCAAACCCCAYHRLAAAASATFFLGLPASPCRCGATVRVTCSSRRSLVPCRSPLQLPKVAHAANFFCTQHHAASECRCCRWALSRRRRPP